MILEAIRILSDWMGDATNGVNAKLATMTVDGADSAPPSIARILNPTEDVEAVRGQGSADWPTLYVTVDEPVEADGEVAQTHRDAGDIPVTILYATRDGDEADAVRDGMYTLRAIVLSVRELNRQANEASRTRNGVCLYKCNRIVYGRTEGKLDDGTMITGYVTASFTARDTTP